jgi:hypothetical protein
MRRRTKKNVRTRAAQGAARSRQRVAESGAADAPAAEPVRQKLEIPYSPVRRPRSRNRFFAGAFLISALIHLSTVTLFNIVIYFPRRDVAYYDVEIVRAAPRPVRPVSGPDQLRGPDLERAFRDVFAEDAPGTASGLPEIELPVLEFAELSRLRIRQQSLESASRYGDLFDENYSDSWGRFGQGLRQLRQSLTGLDSAADRAEAGSSLLRLNTVEGFQAFIEWSGGPADRKLLYAPPLKALWRIRPADLDEKAEIVFEVTPTGRVANVWSPSADAAGILDSLQLTILQYRFSPLEVDRKGNQMGVLTIRGGEARP